MKKEDMKNFVSAFFIALEYNGEADTLKYIISELEKGNTQIIFDDLEQRFIWSVLVVMFGDYGTAPRTGWIENVVGCIEFLNENLNTEK